MFTSKYCKKCKTDQVAALWTKDPFQCKPLWLTPADRAELKRIYFECPKGHDVDHIIPLKGKEVRGLHVPWNLQYLPSIDNRRKGNRV